VFRAYCQCPGATWTGNWNFQTRTHSSSAAQSLHSQPSQLQLGRTVTASAPGTCKFQASTPSSAAPACPSCPSRVHVHELPEVGVPLTYYTTSTSTLYSTYLLRKPVACRHYSRGHLPASARVCITCHRYLQKLCSITCLRLGNKNFKGEPA